MPLADSFYISLASDESDDFFDHTNKKSMFTNKLPEPLILNSDYLVALTEIYIPPFYPHSSTKYDEEHEVSDESESENEIKKIPMSYHLIKRVRRSTDTAIDLSIDLKGTDGWSIFVSEQQLAELRDTPFYLGELANLFIASIYDKEGNIIRNVEQKHFKPLTRKYYDMFEKAGWTDHPIAIEPGDNSLEVLLPYQIEHVKADEIENVKYKKVVLLVKPYDSLER